MPKLIMIDIDSTINDHWKRIRRNTFPQWPGGRIHAKAFTRDEIMKDRMLPGAGTAIRRMLAVGFQVEFLTAREFAGAAEITVEWLEKWGIGGLPVTLVHCMDAKLDVVKNWRPEYLIDDFITGQENMVPTFRHAVAGAIAAEGVKVIVFRNDWDDVLDQIQMYEEAI